MAWFARSCVSLAGLRHAGHSARVCSASRAHCPPSAPLSTHDAGGRTSEQNEWPQPSAAGASSSSAQIAQRSAPSSARSPPARAGKSVGSGTCASSADSVGAIGNG
jgi:hypothetical protein